MRDVESALNITLGTTSNVSEAEVDCAVRQQSYDHGFIYIQFCSARHAQTNAASDCFMTLRWHLSRLVLRPHSRCTRLCNWAAPHSCNLHARIQGPAAADLMSCALLLAIRSTEPDAPASSPMKSLHV